MSANRGSKSLKMSANKGRRRARKDAILKALERRYKVPTVNLYPYLVPEDAAEELKEFKEKQRMSRRILQDRERLVADALELMEAGRDFLANQVVEVDVVPQPGTRAYTNFLKREEKAGKIPMDAIIARRNQERILFGAPPSLLEKRYQSKINEFIQRYGISRLRKMLSKEHIEALQNDQTSFNRFRSLATDILMTIFQDVDKKDSHECTFCDKIFFSNRLRREHARVEHFPYFAKKALNIIQTA